MADIPDKLKHCPFCGNEDLSIEHHVAFDACCVICNAAKTGCGASGAYSETVEEAVAAWQKRVGFSEDR